MIAKHALGAVLCSVGVFVVWSVLIVASNDYGEALSGDVVVPLSNFSMGEKLSYNISLAMIYPIRWAGPKIGVILILPLILAWGSLGYLGLLFIFRKFRRCGPPVPCPTA